MHACTHSQRCLALALLYLAPRSPDPPPLALSLRYRTQLCSYGLECKRGICFFAHHPRDVRVHEHSAQLAALEAQLQASDPAFAAPAPGGNGGQRRPADSNDGSKSDRQHLNNGGNSNQQHGPLAGTHSVDSVQAEHLRQLHHAMQQQGMNLQGMGGNGYGHAFLPGQQLPAHASAAAAAAALLEAALQPSTPPVGQHGLQQHNSLAPLSSLSHPMGPMPGQHGGQEDPMAATMRLLAELSTNKAGPNSSMHLNSVSSMPPMLHHPQQGGGDDAEVREALHLVAQLQQLVSRARNSGNVGVQAVLASTLPTLVVQLGTITSNNNSNNNNNNNGSNSARGDDRHGPFGNHGPVGPFGSPNANGMHGSHLLNSCVSAPVPQHLQQQLQQHLQQQQQGGWGQMGGVLGQQQQQQQLGMSRLSPRTVGGPTNDSGNSNNGPKQAAGSQHLISPADVLSVPSPHTAGSICSSRLSDGTRSPPLSHHSDEDGNGNTNHSNNNPSAASLRHHLSGGPHNLAATNTSSLFGGSHSASFGFSSLPTPRRASADSDGASAGGAGPAGAPAAAAASSASKLLFSSLGRDQLGLPLTLDGHSDLASTLADMSGAKAMIASLHELVDSDICIPSSSPSATATADNSLFKAGPSAAPGTAIEA